MEPHGETRPRKRGHANRNKQKEAKVEPEIVKPKFIEEEEDVNDESWNNYHVEEGAGDGGNLVYKILFFVLLLVLGGLATLVLIDNNYNLANNTHGHEDLLDSHVVVDTEPESKHLDPNDPSSPVEEAGFAASWFDWLTIEPVEEHGIVEEHNEDLHHEFQDHDDDDHDHDEGHEDQPFETHEHEEESQVEEPTVTNIRIEQVETVQNVEPETSINNDPVPTESVQFGQEVEAEDDDDDTQQSSNAANPQQEANNNDDDDDDDDDDSEEDENNRDNGDNVVVPVSEPQLVEQGNQYNGNEFEASESTVSPPSHNQFSNDDLNQNLDDNEFTVTNKEPHFEEAQREEEESTFAHDRGDSQFDDLIDDIDTQHFI